MKKLITKIILVAAIFLSSNSIWSQKTAVDSDQKIYEYKSVEVKPEFFGGMPTVNSYLSEAFKKSGISISKKSKNKVFAQFIIEKDGSLKDCKLLSKIKLKEENDILAILQNLPNWKAGSILSDKVRVLHVIEITENLKW